MTKKDPQLDYQVPTAGKQSNSNQNASVGYKYMKSWNKNNGPNLLFLKFWGDI
jgi:hypothetical protein